MHTVFSEAPATVEAVHQDRSSSSVPTVSTVSWIQEEFEEDLREMNARQEADMEAGVATMKRADVLVLVDMYSSCVSPLPRQLPACLRRCDADNLMTAMRPGSG